jgi:nucleotide-binding universal stress UspA family protein
MTIRDLAVHVDYRDRCRKGLDVAVGLAERCAAHLTGVYVDSVPIAPEMMAMSTAPVLLETIAEEQQERAASARRIFDAATQRAGLNTSFRRSEGPMFAALNQMARYSDLLVLTQEGDGKSGPVLGGFADYAVMDCGRPVLVVPFVGAAAPVDGTVLVAWSGTRESARAANDALPLLALASRVQVLVIEPEDTQLSDAHLPGADFCEHLARHDIKAEAKVIPGSDVDAGDLLLSHAADVDANLIVMGAYGHSRLRQLVLGGMTRHMLTHMTVPVLMSH